MEGFFFFFLFSIAIKIMFNVDIYHISNLFTTYLLKKASMKIDIFQYHVSHRDCDILYRI